jgi:elongation factor Ts
MAITAMMVKQLREKTGAGMMDCKKALVETNANLEAAVDWLRKKGLSAAAKKSDREAADGLVGIMINGNKAVAIELNSETDFVAKNEKFQGLVRDITSVAMDASGDVDSVLQSAYPGSDAKVSDKITDAIAIIGENINLRRITSLEVSKGLIAGYVHNAVVENIGKIGVLVALESEATPSELEDLGKKLAMHIAAAKPEVLDVKSVNPELEEKERRIFAEQARASGKPENIIEKMIVGRIRKYHAEIVLLEQTYVIDNKSKISEVLAEESKKLGCEIKLSGYIRFELGEGIELKEKGNFADEVASMSGQ